MKTEYFPHFLRCQYPGIDISNEEAFEIGNEFKQYLVDKKLKPDILEKIWDISPLTIIKNLHHPLKIKGYDPAFVLHFTQFAEIMKNKY